MRVELESVVSVMIPKVSRIGVRMCTRYVSVSAASGSADAFQVNAIGRGIVVSRIVSPLAGARSVNVAGTWLRTVNFTDADVPPPGWLFVTVKVLDPGTAEALTVIFAKRVSAASGSADAFQVNAIGRGIVVSRIV